MVRVLSVYHFPAQQTKVVADDIVDSCLIPCTNSDDDSCRLVLAKRSGLIEIYNPESFDEATATFAAIEDILSIRYSIQGNYLACLEQNIAKSNRKSVRVYCNFEQPSPNGIRARIAGKVTPVYSTAESCCLEMLEIPFTDHHQDINLIACCGVS